MLRLAFTQECDLSAILLHPRFAVVTEKADGSMKVAVQLIIHACLLLLVVRLEQWTTFRGQRLVNTRRAVSMDMWLLQKSCVMIHWTVWPRHCVELLLYVVYGVSIVW